MADLIAQGPQRDQRWRRNLNEGAEVTLGRSEAEWDVPWDDRISRVHARLRCVEPNRIAVQRLENARNPLFFQGERRDSFTMMPGEHFVIGQTTFTLATRPSVIDEGSPGPSVTEHAFAAGVLRGRGFRDAASRIDVLARLPELIVSSANEGELLARVAGVLLQGIPDAHSVAILRVHKGEVVSGKPVLDILHYDSRLPQTEARQPKGALVRRASERGESVLHLWHDGLERGEVRDRCEAEGLAAPVELTGGAEGEWAFAIPVQEVGNNSWVLYVEGRFGAEIAIERLTRGESAEEAIQDDLKFAELVGMTLGNLRRMRLLQQQQAGLSRFFAPVVMEVLSGRDPVDVLQPREAEITTLFCDLRGFSRRSEEHAGQLMDLLHRVSEALGVMTRQILHRDGVIGDFHGDAAMGFWGWPLSQEDAPIRACQTAVAIVEELSRQASSKSGSLGNFRCGIGIASGRAVAGRIGTSDQVKVTAFGPVVNLASRLEGMTKIFSAEILVDEATANVVDSRIPKSLARVRRLAKVRPAGMDTPLMVYQILPSSGVQGAPSDESIEAYERALEEVLVGNWDKAFSLLHEVPASDRVKDFLTVFIAGHGRVPPRDWDGVIPLTQK